MEEKLYKTSEVASLHGITKKALQYYDKIDLFKPDYIGDENNYKYYTRKNFPILKQILYLKDIGFELSQIKFLLDNRSHDLIIDKLKIRKKEVDHSIDSLLRTQKSLSFLIDFYEKSRLIKANDLNRPSLRMVDSFSVLSLQAKENQKLDIMLSYRKILNRLKGLNLFSHRPYGTVYFDIDQPHCHRSGSFICLPLDFEIEDQIHVPKGKYISMYHEGTYYNREPLDFLLKWIEDNGYRALGDAYDFCLIDRSFTDDEDKIILELLVRVE